MINRVYSYPSENNYVYSYPSKKGKLFRFPFHPFMQMRRRTISFQEVKDTIDNGKWFPQREEKGKHKIVFRQFVLVVIKEHDYFVVRTVHYNDEYRKRAIQQAKRFGISEYDMFRLLRMKEKLDMLKRSIDKVMKIK